MKEHIYLKIFHYQGFKYTDQSLRSQTPPPTWKKLYFSAQRWSLQWDQTSYPSPSPGNKSLFLFFGNYFFAFSFYHLWMVCPVFAPVQSVPQHALVICFSLSINVRHTHTVVLKLYFTALSLFSCRYWAHGRLVWAFILCHHGIFFPCI